MKELDLEATEVSDDRLRWSHKMNKLERLKLRTTIVTGKGMVHLKPLASLVSISLASTVNLPTAALAEASSLAKAIYS